MPSIIGNERRSGGGVDPYNRSRGTGYGKNFPASQDYQRALDEWDQRRGKPPKPQKTAEPRSTVRPFDLPGNSVPVPYGKLGGRLLSQLRPLAARDPRIRTGLMALDLLATVGARSDQDIAPSNSHRTGYATSSDVLGYGRPWAATVPMMPPGFWYYRTDCPTCLPDINHYFQPRSFSPICIGGQYWGSGSIQTGFMTSACFVFELQTNYLHNGCDRSVRSKWNGSKCTHSAMWTNQRIHLQHVPFTQLQNFPELQPIGMAEMNAPQTIPYDVLPKLRTDPWPQSTKRSRGTRRRPRPRARPSQVRSRQAVVEATTGPGRAPPRIKTRIKEGLHDRRPPNRLEREGKRKTAPRLQQIAGAITEGLDAVGALYDALPSEWRYECEPDSFGRRPKTTDKIRRLLLFVDRGTAKAWREFWPEAIANLAYNHLEDALIGMSARQRQRVYADIGRDAGLPDPLKWATKRLKRDRGEVDCERGPEHFF